MYTVNPIVCDYGVFDNKRNLVVICNSRFNAHLISDIMNCDGKHLFYSYDDFHALCLAYLLEGADSHGS